jgi:hypothetical protein
VWNRAGIAAGIRDGARAGNAAHRILLQHAASVLQKFLLTEMPNMRGVMIVALSSILPVTALSSPATGT